MLTIYGGKVPVRVYLSRAALERGVELLPAVLQRRCAIEALELLAKVVGVGKAHELCNGLHLQPGAPQQLLRRFHPLGIDILGQGVSRFAMKECGQVAAADLNHRCNMRQGQIAGQVCVDVSQRFLHGGCILLSGVGVH